MARFLHGSSDGSRLGFWRRAGFTGVPRFAVALLLLCLAGFFVGCEEIEEEKPWIQVERPQMLFTDTTLLDSYNNNVLSWKLKTAYLERWADKEIVFVRPIFVDIYDSLGERAAFMRADSGRFDMKFTYVNAYGHVYALTPKGASVRADSLIWNKADNLVRTESYVRVVSEDGDVLQGKGFESDAKMDQWKILANVTGIFQDAANRLKEEDKKEAEEHAMPDSSHRDSTGSAPSAAPASVTSASSAASTSSAAVSSATSRPSPALGHAPSPMPRPLNSSAPSGMMPPPSPAVRSAIMKSDTSTGPREMNPDADAEMLRQSRSSLLRNMRRHHRPDTAQGAKE